MHDLQVKDLTRSGHGADCHLPLALELWHNVVACGNSEGEGKGRCQLPPASQRTWSGQRSRRAAVTAIKIKHDLAPVCHLHGLFARTLARSSCPLTASQSPDQLDTSIAPSFPAFRIARQHADAGRVDASPTDERAIKSCQI